MVDTTNKGLAKPASSTGDWDVPINLNFGIIDSAFGGNTIIDVTSVTTTQTLTSAQYQNLIIVFSGVLSANLIYQIPSGVGGQWFIFNGTTGDYFLTVATSASGGIPVSVLTNTGVAVYSDGTNVYQYGFVDLFYPLGVFGGGYVSSSASTIMDYIAIETTGNATTFGNLTVARLDLAGVSNSTTGVFGGGRTTTVSAIMDYISFSTIGNATTFGNLSVARENLAGVSSSTRGVFGGGTASGPPLNTMDYITIATTGNAASFGTLTVSRDNLAGVSSSTRGVFGGGYTTSASAVMDYITIATTGNATNFGTLTLARQSLAGVSSGTRGVFGGGTTTGGTGGESAVMTYITIATTGNGSTFGNLTVANFELAGVSSDIRGVFGGGSSSSSVMDYITIATTGNATSFGSLTVGRYSLAGVSGYLQQ